MVTITNKALVLALMIISFVSLLFLNSHHHTLAQTSTNQTSNMSTYKNSDLGLTMQYPSNWKNQNANLVHNTIAAFLLKENQFHNSLDFANVTLAEVDLRVYPAPQNESSTNLEISQINTQGQAILNYYKNSTTTVGGLPALKIISYLFGSSTQKALQIWTYIPSKHVMLELMYSAEPPEYPLYLPEVQKMIDSVKLVQGGMVNPGQSSGQGGMMNPGQSSGQGGMVNPDQSSGQGGMMNPDQSSGQGGMMNPGQSSGQGGLMGPGQGGPGQGGLMGKP